MFCNGTTWQDYYPDRATREKDQEIRHTVRVVTPPTTEPVTIAEAKAKSDHIKASRHRVILLDAKDLKCMKIK